MSPPIAVAIHGMARRLTQRRIALAAGAGALVVAGVAAVSWERLWEGYQAWQFRRIAVVAVEVRSGETEVRALGHDGRPLWSYLSGGHTGHPEWPRVACAFDTQRFRIYAETYSEGLPIVALGPWGNVLRAQKGSADAMAVDPRSGEIWCLFQLTFGNPPIRIFDANGQELATLHWGGQDMAHNAFDDSFWIVGDELRKFDRTGRELARSGIHGGGDTSIAANHRDGSIWITEHVTLGGSLQHVDSQARLLKEVQLPLTNPEVVVCDPETGAVWVATRGGMGSQVLSFSSQGELLLELPLEAVDLAYSTATKKLWLSTEDRIISLDRQGRVVTEISSRQGSAVSLFAP